MTILFLDTNAILKLYLPEIGSLWTRNAAVINGIVLSELALYEAATVLRRRFLEGSFSRPEADGLYRRILHDIQAYTVVPLGVEQQRERVAEIAFRDIGNLRVRALDAIQLAAAQVAREATSRTILPEPFVFVSADIQLLRVAQALGFATDNPEDPP